MCKRVTTLFLSRYNHVRRITYKVINLHSLGRLLNTRVRSKKFVQVGMVFCYQNCSDLLREKIVLVIEKNF